MTTIKKYLALFLLTGSVCLVGCQAKNEALVREPGLRLYNPPVKAATLTQTTWEYAALSEIVYDREGDSTYKVPHCQIYSNGNLTMGYLVSTDAIPSRKT